MSMKNSKDNIGNRAHNIPACNTVPQTTPPLHTPPSSQYEQIMELGELSQE